MIEVFEQVLKNGEIAVIISVQQGYVLLSKIINQENITPKPINSGSTPVIEINLLT